MPPEDESPTPTPTPDQRRLVEETKNERYMWWYLGYFLFGIHIVAFVMIYAVTHAK
jgi:hypothetical protein